jgi:hypothetical protein
MPSITTVDAELEPKMLESSIAAERALEPEVAVLVDQVAGRRIDLVAPVIALIVERAVGEFSDSREPAEPDAPLAAARP